MSSIVRRDAHFSMSVTVMDDVEAPGAVQRSKASKRLERRVVRLWKIVTGATRKQPRNSFISPDFVVLTSRRSVYLQGPQLRQFKQ